MEYIIAVTGSITRATRLAKELERNGCSDIRVIHTPTSLSSGGCSYSVRLPYNRLELLTKISEHNRNKIRKIYKENPSDKEILYDDIS